MARTDLTAGDDFWESYTPTRPPKNFDDADEVHALQGKDVLDGKVGPDLLFGDEGRDEIVGGAGKDVLYGGADDDVLRGGPDTVGLWVFEYGPQGTSAWRYLARPTLPDEADELDGGPGNDTLIGDRGDDTLIGGPGNDIYVYYGQGEGFDVVRDGGNPDVAVERDTIEARGSDVWIGMTEFSRALTGIEAIRGSGRGPAQVMGTDGDNVLDFRGVELVDMTGLNGKGGNDTIYGSAGSDTIYGGLRVDSPDGDDKIWGEAGGDKVFGGLGDDEIHGGLGDDWINGQSNNDTIYGDEGNDTIVGEGEDDTVFGGTGNDLVYGSDGKDELNGQDGGDTLFGEAGDDVLIGEAGADQLIGGAGKDYMTGGYGYDVYVYTGKSEGVDWIRDGGDPERAREIDTIEGRAYDPVWINMEAFSRELTGIEVIRNTNLYGICPTPGCAEAGMGTSQVMGTAGDNVLDFRDVALLGLSGLNGGAGSDTIHGSWSNDTIYGGFRLDFGVSDGDDRLYGHEGNDGITGGRGNDIIEGGEGIDTAQYWGRRADYQITALGDGRFTVTDKNLQYSNEGTDTLTAVETVAFADGTVNLADVSRDLRMSWWEDADLGMFVHWGLYAVPAGSWGDTYYCDTSEWLLAKKPEAPTLAEYEALASRFDGSKFDADGIVSLAKAAGMDYLVFTAKHHDGFSMWPSAHTDYDIADRTAFGKTVDPIAELARATDAQGLKFGLYYSIVDWHHPATEPNASPPTTTPSGPCPYPNDDSIVFQSFEDKAAYKQFVEDQLAELIDKYDPDILWFDGNWAGAGAAEPNAWTAEDGAELVAFVRSLAPDIVINDRALPGEAYKDPAYADLADYVTAEKEFAKDSSGQWDQVVKKPYPTAEHWEALISTNWNWGYNAKDDHWRSGEELHALLQDVDENSGNLLINVGPTATGEIPQPAVDSLLRLGSLLGEPSETALALA